MKITQSTLKRFLKEEITKTLKESNFSSHSYRALEEWKQDLGHGHLSAKIAKIDAIVLPKLNFYFPNYTGQPENLLKVMYDLVVMEIAEDAAAYRHVRDKVDRMETFFGFQPEDEFGANARKVSEMDHWAHTVSNAVYMIMGEIVDIYGPFLRQKDQRAAAYDAARKARKAREAAAFDSEMATDAEAEARRGNDPAFVNTRMGGLNESKNRLILENHRKGREVHPVAQKQWWFNA